LLFPALVKYQLQHSNSDHQLGLSNGHYYVSLQWSRGHYSLTGQWADQILFRIFIVICEAHRKPCRPTVCGPPT